MILRNNREIRILGWTFIMINLMMINFSDKIIGFRLIYYLLYNLFLYIRPMMLNIIKFKRQFIIIFRSMIDIDSFIFLVGKKFKIRFVESHEQIVIKRVLIQFIFVYSTFTIFLNDLISLEVILIFTIGLMLLLV